MQDLLDALAGVRSIPLWASHTVTLVFVWSNVATSLTVSDLGSVLHMIGGTAASFMIFCLPGLLLMNAAIIKASASTTQLDALVRSPPNPAHSAAPVLLLSPAGAVTVTEAVQGSALTPPPNCTCSSDPAGGQ